MSTLSKHYQKMPLLEVAKMDNQTVPPQEDTATLEGKVGKTILVETTVAVHQATMPVVETWL